MKLIYFEMKKSWLKLPILFVLILLCILDIYKISDNYRINGRMSGDENKGLKNAYYNIYSNDLRGEITQTKINYVKDACNKYKSEVIGKNFSKEYDENTITGYIYSDYSLFNFIIVPELEYAVTYPNISNSISASAYENIDFFEKHNNFPDAEKNRYIYKLYQNRNIDNYNLTEWTELYFKYDFSSLLVLIMLVVTLAPSFTSEYESGMNVMIKSSGKQGNIVNAKLISAALFIFLLTVLFAFFDLLSVNFFCGADGFLNPVYSSPFFKYSPFNFSLFSAIIICALIKFLAFLTIGEIIFIISRLTKNTILSICFSFLIVVLLIVLSNADNSVLNPVNMLSPYKMLTEFKCVIFAGKPILSLYYSAVVCIIINMILFAVIKYCGKEVKNVRI